MFYLLALCSMPDPTYINRHAMVQLPAPPFRRLAITLFAPLHMCTSVRRPTCSSRGRAAFTGGRAAFTGGCSELAVSSVSVSVSGGTSREGCRPCVLGCACHGSSSPGMRPRIASTCCPPTHASSPHMRTSRGSDEGKSSSIATHTLVPGSVSDRCTVRCGVSMCPPSTVASKTWFRAQRRSLDQEKRRRGQR